ncbi:tetratricopeptide repeat protein [Seonamhaeicola sediminis]|uniref:Tetratricopeptide repeat protein n=1 Tax=Seonamhaeicola sediminis TaxID=2528206 RepID=A0A562YF97_9FLAO|nr:tetratricopeptide repeat protein [Seonamhaeicola sediminis]TWO32954.1 tetratricopeptide repeat protein [Seonamhaeicola sediminis]
MKRNFLFFLLVIFICNSAITQNQKYIDSLKNELKNRKEDDSIKVVILTMLHENLMFSNPEEARNYAMQELNIYKKNGLELAYGLGNLHLGDYFYNKTKNDSAKYYYKIAKQSFLKNKKTRGLIFVNYTLAEIYKTEGEYHKALKIFNESLDEINKHIKEPYYKKQFNGGSYLAIGSCYLEKGDLNLALTNSLKAKDLFEKINDGPRLGDALRQIGHIERQLEHLKSSLDYYLKALKIYNSFNDIIYVINTTGDIGRVYKELGELKNAENYLLKAIDLSKEHNINSTLASALHDLGHIYMIRQNYTLARKVLKKSRTISEKENMNIAIIQAYEALSKIDYYENDFHKALSKIDYAISITKKSGAILSLSDLYDFKSTILESLNRNKESIKFLKASQRINDSILSIKKIQQIEELKTIYETEKKEAQIALQNEEIKTLNIQAKNDKLTKTLYGTGMISFIVIAGLLFFGFKQRIKKNKIEREKQEEIYKQEIAFKKKELASQTLHLVQKNTFIQELKENLEKIKQSPELFKIEFRRLVMLLKKESAEDKDWEVFKSYFSEVHNNFDNKLKTVYADITEKEIRLASFLRMNLSTKEIASMLNVLPESVLKSKYRLKKKLNLDKETDLNAFLNSL